MKIEKRSAEARAYFTDYVRRQGGLYAAAKKLKTPYSSLAAIANGGRGIGYALADRFCRADRTLDASLLVWVRPTKPPK
jgi:hypothetical protein